MRRSWVRGLVQALLAGGLLAAVPAGAAEAVPATTWAKKTCAAVGAWLTAVDEAADVDSTPTSDTLVLADRLDTMLSVTGDATETLVRTVKKAGVPDLPKGKQIAMTYRKAYGGLADAVAEALEELRSVDRGAPIEALETALVDAQGAFEEAITDAQAVIDGADVLASKPLTKTMRKVPSCIAITG